MMPASELKITRVISTPGIFIFNFEKKILSIGFSENKFGKKASLRTCGDTIESDDGDQRQKSINNNQRDFRTREGGEGE
jgi:hypothetical protein